MANAVSQSANNARVARATEKTSASRSVKPTNCRCQALVLELTEPHGDRTRFVCLKQLMNPGRTHPVARATCRIDSPASFAATIA